MSWKEKLSFIAPSYVEHEVSGEILRFYPISLKSSFRIRHIAAPIAKALSAILGKNDGDQGQHIKTKMKAGQVEDQDVRIEAISKEIAELRTREREAAFSSAINTLLDPELSLVIGLLIADSLRDIFPKDIPKDEIKSWMDSVPLPQVTEMIIGLAKANRKVLGPFAEAAKDLMKRAADFAKSEEVLPPQETTG